MPSAVPSLPPITQLYPWEVLGRSGAERLADLVAGTRGQSLTRLRIVPRTFWMVNDADGARYVLQENAKNYKKSKTYDQLKSFLGNGLFTSEGDFWKRQRRLAQPAFHQKHLAVLADSMVTEAVATAERWEQHLARGTSFDLAHEMMRLTLSIVGRTLFGTDLSEGASSVSEALTYALKSTDRRLLAPLRIPRGVPTVDNVRFARALRVLDRHVQAIIDARRRTPGQHQDLLSMLLDARDDNGEGMSDRQLRDEVMTLVLAGHETTANALSWAFYLLSLNPAVARRLRAQFAEVLGGRVPTFADLPQLRYANMVMQESMRLYPPVWVVEREPLTDDVITGYRVPAGSTVAVCVYTLHHNAAYWTNPEGFDPERFTPEAIASRPKFAYLPFGGGPRICIGNHFAVMEAQIILAVLLQRFQIDVVSGARVEPELTLTLRPKGGIPVTLRPASAPMHASVTRTPGVRPSGSPAAVV